MMMKKTYETPVAEKIEFRYQEQVAASISTISCIPVWINIGETVCEKDNTLYDPKNT